MPRYRPDKAYFLRESVCLIDIFIKQSIFL
nr:MAG TPA: hypothetical protein [Caudoviricetes sp.]